MCNKAVGNYSHALEFVLKCYKTQKMCDKAVNAYPSATKFVPECCKTQEMCNKGVHSVFLNLIIFLIKMKLKTQKLENYPQLVCYK